MFSKIRKASRLATAVAEATKNTPKDQHLAKAISTDEVINRENKYAAHNYHPLPVALSRGQGMYFFHYSIKRDVIYFLIIKTIILSLKASLGVYCAHKKKQLKPE